jgi:hypothetical protein
MSKPETKVVLGRRFAWNAHAKWWECPLKSERWLTLETCESGEHLASVRDVDVDHFGIEYGRASTEADAILALQSQLRKMAELEVAE